MTGVLLGFTTILTLMGVGIVAGLLLPEPTVRAMRTGLSPAIYYVSNPALMLILLAKADLGTLFGVYMPIALATAAAAGLVHAAVSRWILRHGAAHSAVGAMAASYGNAGTIGVPLAMFAMSDAGPAVAVLTAQLLLIAPAYLVLFGWLDSRHRADRGGQVRTALRSIANPVTVATAVGAVIAAVGWEPPKALWTPITMLGEASVPLLLVLFGLSLVTQRPLSGRGMVVDVVVATAVKTALMPVVAWFVASSLFHLSGAALMGAVVMAALPTAQNVFLFSDRFDMPSELARDVVLTTTLASLPSILMITLLMGST
ncbi:AEC family transporter [Micrococcus sp. HG099]|uniref:AEC family transporter n=1 Tax=Micrococcus sp. HG099 TaxID=2969755 RepID=UPI00215B4B6B|nr:AEC family transporter [Micrococcus sp. HG099]MCR8674556.1 AEC family transporter [Micrococcus sp. HG099]